jgi:hypothetical protein
MIAAEETVLRAGPEVRVGPVLPGREAAEGPEGARAAIEEDRAPVRSTRGWSGP